MLHLMDLVGQTITFIMMLSTFYTEPYVRYTVVVTAATSVGKGNPYIMAFYTKEGGKHIHYLKY